MNQLIIFFLNNIFYSLLIYSLKLRAIIKTKLAEFQERQIEAENSVENAKEELNSSQTQMQVLESDKLVLNSSKQLKYSGLLQKNGFNLNYWK